MSTQIAKTVATVIACGLSCYLAASPIGVAHAASAPAATTIEASQSAESVHQSLFGLNPDAGWLEIDGFAGVPGTYHGSMSDDNFAATIVSAEPITIDGADGVFLVEATLSSSMGSAVTSAYVVADGTGTSGAALIPIPAITTLLLQTAPPQGPGVGAGGGGGGAGGGGAGGGGGGGGGIVPCPGTVSPCNFPGTTCEDFRNRAICMAANMHNLLVCAAINRYLAALTAARNAYFACAAAAPWDPRCDIALWARKARARATLQADLDAAGEAYSQAVQAAGDAYLRCVPRTGNVPPSYPLDLYPPTSPVWNL